MASHDHHNSDTAESHGSAPNEHTDAEHTDAEHTEDAVQQSLSDQEAEEEAIALECDAFDVAKFKFIDQIGKFDTHSVVQQM